MRIKLIVAYDGSEFYGFEHQTNKRNVEDEILKSIKKVDPTVDKIYASGRTDRYVHAKGQVVHFDSEKDIKDYRWMLAINTHLPEDIRVLESAYVSDDFHARYSALRKEYRYLIRYKDYSIFDRNYYDFFTNIDIDLVKECLKKFEGSHDFRGFCSAQIHPLKNTIKIIYHTELIVHDEYLELVFLGDGFLKHQVRKMCGTIIDVATGKKDISVIDLIFETRDPKLSNRVLSGHGLYLEKVFYE